METDWSHTIKNLVIVLLMALVVIRCGGREEPEDIEVDHYTDTTYITHIDTTLFYDTIVKTKTLLSYTNITNIEKDTSKLYTFKTHVSDSLITGDITTNIKVKDSVATLINQDIAYKPLFPKYIHQTDSIIIHDSTVVTIYKSKPKMFIGADVAIGNSTNNGTIVPKLGIDFNSTILETGYDIFNKQFVIGAKYKLNFKKKK